MSSQQLPSVSILDQDIVRIELHTKALGGLSSRDLQLSQIIDALDPVKYKLVALETEKDYKKVIRRKRIQDEMKAMEDEILSSEGSRFENKFKESEKLLR